MLSLALFRVMGHVGVAFATAIAAIVQSYLLLRGTISRGLYRPGREFGVFFVKVLAATTVMVAVLVGLSPESAHWLHVPTRERALWLLGLSAIGGLVYFLVLLIAGLRPRELRYHV